MLKNGTQTYISLFSSAGVGCYGFKQEGYQCIATCEILEKRLNIQKYNDYHIWDYVAEKKAKGLVRHYGFSFHSDPDLLEQLLEEHPEVEFVQLQINYADWENPASQSRGVYETARKYGIPVVIMEPLDFVGIT